MPEGVSPSKTGPSGLRAGVEILRRYLVEELPKPLDLAVVVGRCIVGHRNPGLIENRVGPEDRDLHAHGKRDRIGRPRRDLHAVAEVEGGEEDAVLQVVDGDLGKLGAERAQGVAHEVMRERASGDDALLGKSDSGRFYRSDPDRQIALAANLTKKDDRLL